ncbi:hypothetical protein TrRE_jg5506, partial [Triparma retinervis]
MGIVKEGSGIWGELKELLFGSPEGAVAAMKTMTRGYDFGRSGRVGIREFGREVLLGLRGRGVDEQVLGLWGDCLTDGDVEAIVKEDKMGYGSVGWRGGKEVGKATGEAAGAGEVGGLWRKGGEEWRVGFKEAIMGRIKEGEELDISEVDWEEDGERRGMVDGAAEGVRRWLMEVGCGGRRGEIGVGFWREGGNWGEYWGKMEEAERREYVEGTVGLCVEEGDVGRFIQVLEVSGEEGWGNWGDVVKVAVEGAEIMKEGGKAEEVVKGRLGVEELVRVVEKLG